LFVCQQKYAKQLRNQFSQNSTEKWRMSHKKKTLDFDGNPDHVILGLGLV